MVWSPYRCNMSTHVLPTEYPGFPSLKSPGGAGAPKAKSPVAQVYCQFPSTSDRIPIQGSIGPVVQTNGTLYRSATVDMPAFIGGGSSPYARKCTLSFTIKDSASVPALSGSLSVLTMTSLTGSLLSNSFTYTPPSLLISSTAASIPNTPPSPKPAYIPVNGAGTPIRISSFGPFLQPLTINALTTTTIKAITRNFFIVTPSFMLK